MINMTYDVDYIKSLYKTSFGSCKSAFKSKYNGYQNSYFKNCSDSTIVKIKDKLNNHYNKINKIYNSIDDYWNKYLNDVSNADKVLAENAKISSINATSISQKLSALPELKTYSDDISVEIQTNSQIDENIESLETEDLEIEESNKFEEFWNKLTDWFSSLFTDVQDKIDETGAVISSWISSFVLDVNSKLSDDAIIVDVKNLADETLDREFPSKTTLAMVDGTRIEYDKKIKNSDGSIEYFDEDGNLIKKIYTNGTVETYYEDKHYIFNLDGTFNIIMNDTENYYYDSTGKLIKRVFTREDGSISRIDYFDEDEVGNYKARSDYATDIYKREYIDENGNIYWVNESIYDDSGNYLYSKYVKYYESGQVKSVEEGDGNITEYDENGNIISIKKDDKTTYEASYYENGNIETEYDKENNIYKEYYESGNIKKVEESINEDEYACQITSYYESGQVKSVYKCAVSDDGLKNYGCSTSTSYYKSGEIYSIQSNDNGVRTITYYYENGNIKEKHNADGSREFYDENGSFQYEMKANEHGMKYVGGIRTFYDENGNVTRSYQD